MNLKNIGVSLLLLTSFSAYGYNGRFVMGDRYPYPGYEYKVWKLQECTSDMPNSRTLERWNCNEKQALELGLNATNIMLTLIGTCANPTPKGLVLSMGFGAAFSQVIGMFVTIVPCDDFENDAKQAYAVCQVIAEMTGQSCDPKKIVIKRERP